MTEQTSWFETPDGTRLFLYRWIPDSQKENEKPLAVLHLVHGMAEHAFRYRRLAERCTARGIEVWAADQRGHGRTADIKVNDPSSGGLRGHCADSGGFQKVTADIHAINREIRNIFDDTPLFLMGHSWGSFIVQNYIECYDGKGCTINGCILSGTRGPGGFKVLAGSPVMTVFAAIRGRRTRSRFARTLAAGSFNKPFRPNRTPADWLSRDDEEVDKGLSDPYCGDVCTIGFFRDLVNGLCQIHRRGAMARIRKDLPLYVFSGADDPAGVMGKSPTALVEKYRSLGIGDIELVLYPGARHETLNEINREEVMNDLLSWIHRRGHKERENY